MEQHIWQMIYVTAALQHRWHIVGKNWSDGYHAIESVRKRAKLSVFTVLIGVQIGLPVDYFMNLSETLFLKWSEWNVTGRVLDDMLNRIEFGFNRLWNFYSAELMFAL